MAGDVIGFGLQTFALTVGSVVVVQPVVSVNLLFALAIGALLARRALTGGQWAATTGCVAGLVGFLVVAQPTEHSDAVAGAGAWALAVGVPVTVVAVVLVAGWTASAVRRGLLFGFAAGVAEAVMAVLAKAFGDRLAQGVAGTFRSWEPYVLVGSGVLTLLVVQTSYGVGLPTVTLPVNTIAEPLTATSIGVGLFGERLHLASWRGPAVVAALLVMGWSLVRLARDPNVAGAEEVAREPCGHESCSVLRAAGS
jgi:drug/metabolite transporter (DMT)-like permease